MSEWTQIPAAITSEADRRALAGILTQYGLEFRIVKRKDTPKGTPRPYCEFREQEAINGA